MLTTLSTLLRTRVKTPEAAKAAKDISLRRKPVYQGDLDDIEMYFMAAVKEIKKGIGSHYTEQEAMSKKAAELQRKKKNALAGCRIATARAEKKPYIEQNGRAYYNEEKAQKGGPTSWHRNICLHRPTSVLRI